MSTTLPGFIQKKCNDLYEILPVESNEKLTEITDEILETLNDSWNNSAFSPEEAEVLNEGTYLTNLIVQAI
ncbi:12335_t:CDS:2 [Funneliformis geosporum]|nr:12335_t:CDS:2 [Funneliformis geosporum]